MENLDNNEIDRLWNKESYYELIEKNHVKENLADKFIIQNIAKVISEQQIKTVLDLGCGEGSVLEDLVEILKNNDIRYCGVDVSDVGILKAREKKFAKAEFVKYDGVRIPYPDAGFDLALSTFAFEHLHQPEKIFAEMVRITKSGGMIIVACPNYGSPFFRSPCNQKSKLSLLCERLVKSFKPSKDFQNNFNWDKVQPLISKNEVHVSDYDTLTEPNLLFFLKFLQANKNNFELVNYNSFWDKYEHQGKNILKKMFLNFMKTLGKHNFPIIKYYGPFFYVELKKKI